MLDPESRTPLHYAALEDHWDEVRRLLEEGADPNAPDRQGFRPLHLAAQQYSIESAKELVRNGAEVDVVNRYGNTPLFVAVFNSRGRGELIQLLLERGADPDIANLSGQTPRGLARIIANYDVARYIP